MKIKGIDGKTYNWNITNNSVLLSDERERSELHVRARIILKEIFPFDRILEEVFLPSVGLYGDFYIPKQKMMIECHGRQHYEFIKYFHKTAAGFIKSLQRDNQKKEFCEINEIELVELPYNESDNQWRARITSTLSIRKKDD